MVQQRSVWLVHARHITQSESPCEVKLARLSGGERAHGEYFKMTKVDQHSSKLQRHHLADHRE